MSVTPPQIECFLFIGLDGLNRIDLTDSGGGPVSFYLTSTAPVSEALTDWQTQANADATLAGTYTFGYVSASGVVRFSCTENFTLALRGSTPEAFGFSAASYAGASVYSSDLTPLAVYNPSNIDYEIPKVAREHELKRYRWGRITSRSSYRARISRIVVSLPAADWEDLGHGPLLAARARYYPLGYTSGAWSSSNLRGYLDVHPYDPTDVSSWGNLDADTEIALVGVVG